MTGDLSGVRLVLAGGGGFIGSHVTRQACTRGARVSVVVRRRTDRLVALKEEFSGIVEILGDLRQPDVWSAAMAQKPDAILLAAGAAKVSLGWRGARVGVDVVMALGEGLERTGWRPVCIVGLGSQAEYGDAPMPWTESSECLPRTPYGVSKLIATTGLGGLARILGIRATTVRLPIVYGPAQDPTMLIPSTAIALLRGRVFEATAGEQRRGFLFVEDAAGWCLDVVARMMESDLPPVLNSPWDGPHQVRDVLQMIERLSDRDGSIALGELPYREHELMDAWPDRSLIDRLGLSAPDVTPLIDGLSATVSWYRSRIGALG